ncbi:MAG: NAD-dependent epimerase/dehydratase family protein [Xanthomonadales bacterium]|nr:NAD-dependent epimerase/dehydratase family protein [Xanthomonadales bacterium]
MPLDRRELLTLAALGGAHLALGHAALAAAPPTRPLRILILGGTGFTGPHQVRYALSRGHHLTLFNRGRRPQDWPGEVVELTGDRDTGDLASLADGEWDVCIDNPTSVPVWVRDAGQVLKGRVGHYIFISTISVYDDNSQPGMTEDAAVAQYTGEDRYAETMTGLRANMALYGPLKAASEAEARAQFGADQVTVIRPGLIVGPGDQTDRFSYWPLRLRRGGDVVAPGDGSDPVQFIDARDLAEWTIRMAEQPQAGTYNATGPDYELSTLAMLYGIRASTTAGARLHWLPTEFLQEQNVNPWSDMPVWVPGQGDSAGFARTSIARALAAGLSFRPLATTTADLLQWYDQQPEERRASLRAGLSPEREAEVLAAWRLRD